MPAFETRDLEQDALLWEITGVDRYGRYTVGEPTEIKVRWLTKRRQMTTGKGDTITLDAMAIVDQEIPIGSRLWLGVLDDWVGTGTGAEVTDEEVHEVKTVSETTDIKARNIRYELGLMKFRDVPPA